MGEVDLHVHSTCSDGYRDPDHIVMECIERGVRVLSITDHWSIEGSRIARNHVEEMGLNDLIQIISGTEITTSYNDDLVEFLIYELPLTDEINVRLDMMHKNLKLHPIDVLKFANERNAIASLAHPRRSLSLEKCQKYIPIFKSWGLHAIEAIYHSHTEEDVESMIALAVRNDLLISGGSDHHGLLFSLGESYAHLDGIIGQTKQGPISMECLSILNKLNLEGE